MSATSTGRVTAQERADAIVAELQRSGFASITALSQESWRSRI